jgi:2-amino-4-hydroxy-6-hydroxymethyldihydropteridine diphosphokinase
MIEVAISLGSNLGNGKQNILKAMNLLEMWGIEKVLISSFYETEPEGFESANKFTNAAAIIKTSLSAEDLIKVFLRVESELGRTRSVGLYEDRIVDLDLLLYGSDVLETELAIVPHPRMHLRRFVLEPLFEIAPNWEHPVLKSRICDILVRLNSSSSSL